MECCSLFKHSFIHLFFSYIFPSASFFFSPPLLPLLVSLSTLFSLPSSILSRIVKDIWKVKVAQSWSSIFEKSSRCPLPLQFWISSVFIQALFVSLLPVHFGRLNESIWTVTFSSDNPVSLIFPDSLGRITHLFWMEHLARDRGPGSCYQALLYTFGVTLSKFLPSLRS